ncbi:MAG: saccharopine dehydrogenase [Hyphomonas sp.]|uniref:saccharopine dehydrogenase NADP-binding domain-containing protein n=1 Tax=Hyphomonas sp. TaxID=87 RepID=UPI001D9902E4|nr:saccharopine dehydrogenase NADP-binding domain-containing protein [Hyphomonas sp.]MBA4227166.1 saccharopine dehydrogenase [Hyphomonas sp.]
MLSESKLSGSKQVAVYGATGLTGRFVVDELLRRKLVPVAIGRDAGKLEAAGFASRGVETRLASLDDPQSFERAFEGAGAVINCAGPFLDTAGVIAPAAISAGLHYLDVTAEQASAANTLAMFDHPAAQAGVTVMPAMAFFGGFLDLMVTAAADGWRDIEEVSIGIALDSWHPTEGTRQTGRRNTAQRLVIRNGCLIPLPQPPAEREWDFPPPFNARRSLEVPFSEVPLILQHLNVQTLHTYLNAEALQDIRDPLTPPPQPADELGRSAQVFATEVRVTSKAETRTALATGKDIYAFTAPLVCEAARLLLRGGAGYAGAAAPGKVFNARTFLETLGVPGFHIAFE